MDETIPDLVCPACGGRGTDAYCPLDGQRRLVATAFDSGDPLIGKVIAGRYAIERRIGQGGMGAVYLAMQALVDRQVVVKVMRADTGFDDLVRGRFLREARAASRVLHPNVITIFDFGYTDDGMAYLVMERVDGPSLYDVQCAEERLPWRRAARIVAQTARALDAAHKAGIVHRDVKPANVVLAKNEHDPGGPEVVKLLDFGVARLLEPGDARLTRTGAVMGTPAYMAPEQAAGREVGPPADIYALGAMLFDLITGEVPFAGYNITDVLIQHLAAPPPTMRSVVSGLVIPDALETLVAACLAKKPEQRPPSAAAVADELERLAASEPEPPRAARFERAALDETGEASAVAPTVKSTAVSTAPVGSLAPLGEAPGVTRVSAVPRKQLIRWAIAMLLVMVALVATVLLLQPPSESPMPETTDRGDVADDAAAQVDAAVATSTDGAPVPTEVTAPIALPPIPKPRGLRLDGMPVD